MYIEKFVFNLFQECTYLVWDDSKECIIIDPGCDRTEDRQKLKDAIQAKGLKPAMVVLTHSHLDHIYGVHDLQQTYGIPVYMDPREEGSIRFFNAGLVRMGIHTPEEFDWTPVEDGQQLHFGNTTFRAISTPGHSRGGLCWWFEDDNVIFTGDTLFAGSIGRTDNEWASLDDLMHSLRDTLMQLDGGIDVYPGHGPATSIGRERTTNPFIYEDTSLAELLGHNEQEE